MASSMHLRTLLEVVRQGFVPVIWGRLSWFPHIVTVVALQAFMATFLFTFYYRHLKVMGKA